MAERIRVDLCGPLAVTRGGRRLSGPEIGSRKTRALLALLSIEPGMQVPASRIHDALWSSAAPADPGANLASLVSRLRRLLGDTAVLGTRSGYQLAEAEVVTDLGEATDLVRRAAASVDGEPGVAVAAASRALVALAGGEPVADEPSADWAEPARGRAAEVRRGARHVLTVASTVIGDHRTAVAAATDAVEAVPFDEQAHRDLMRAFAADGRGPAALEVYGALAARLGDELGVDPDEETRSVHVAILRQERAPVASGTAHLDRPERVVLIGREDEMARLERAWSAAAAGTASLTVVVGEAGIGKTRLLSEAADVATRTGGQVLSARCHAGESSLFLQPFVDLLAPLLLRQPPSRLGELLGRHAATWAALVPDLAPTLDVESLPPAAPDVERKRAYDAVTSLLHALQLRQPLLIVVDDLQDAGAATVDLLGFLVRHLGFGRVMVLVAARAEASATVDRVSRDGDRIDLGPLPPSAVTALASAAGLSQHALRVMARTAGHPLSVVESLRAIQQGSSGVPATLTEAILARVDRLDDVAREGLEAASVLGVRVVPQDLAALLHETELATINRCRALVQARLLVVRGVVFEFTNDLVQEAVLASLPQPLAQAHHRRAADVLVGRPEEMAVHADAVGDTARAALGWLLAGEDGLRRAAVEDAWALFDRALQAARSAGRSDLTARALLARARARDVLTDYQDALRDIEEGLVLARESGHTRLEMAAELLRGSDVAVAMGRPLADCDAHLAAGLGLATLLGDRAAESEFTTRLTVLEASRLRLSGALRRARSSLARARSSGDENALVPALDGLKAAHAYLGNSAELAAAVDELLPLLRRRGDTFLLPWAVLESSFVPAARGGWATARALVDDALDLNRRSGYLAYAAYFQAQRGWLARLAGDLPAALEDGRRSLAESSPVDHPWWYATAAGLFASTLLEAGRRDEAAEVAARGARGVDVERPEAFRLRCLAPLAAATGDDAVLHEATSLIEGITAPPGRAWVPGADAYLDIAAAWLSAGEPETARRVLAPLRQATSSTDWAVVHERAERLQNISASS